MVLSIVEAIFLGIVLEGLFYGAYCITFGLYLANLKKLGGRNILIYSNVALFFMCTAILPSDFALQLIDIYRAGGSPGQQTALNNLDIFRLVLYSLVPFFSQSILIYHCWVIWGRRLLIILLPSTLALVSFATSLTLDGEYGFLLKEPQVAFLPTWYYPLGVATSSLYAAGNAVICGLLVLNLSTVHRGVARSSPASRLGSLMTALLLFVETGMLLFLGQVICVILYGLQSESAGIASFQGPLIMIYGISPTTTIIRATMRASPDRHEDPERSLVGSIEENLKQ